MNTDRYAKKIIVAKKEIRTMQEELAVCLEQEGLTTDAERVRAGEIGAVVSKFTAIRDKDASGLSLGFEN